MSLSLIGPLIWGIIMQKPHEAFWMAMAAQCISLIDMKGLVDHHLRLVITASFLCVVFGLIGTVMSQFPLLNIIIFFFIGFISGLFKNLGERGAGLALSIYQFYILTSAQSMSGVSDMDFRLKWISFGALWSILIQILSYFFVTSAMPYRRAIAKVWKNIAVLAETVGMGWDGFKKKKSIRDIYITEQKVIAAMSAAEEIFLHAEESMQRDKKNTKAISYAFRSVNITSMYIIQMSEVLQEYDNKRIAKNIQIQIFSIFRSLQQVAERMAVYIHTLRPQEKAIIDTRFKRLKNTFQNLENYIKENNLEEYLSLIEKFRLPIQRIERVVNSTIKEIQKEADIPVYSSYSFIETLQILHPNYIKNNFKQLFDFNSLTTKYAVRLGIASSFAAFIAFMFFPNHGYWIILTTMLVTQPYFGATLKKGIERSIGTIAGIITGTFILWIGDSDWIRLLLIFFGAVYLVYFINRYYSLVSFFVTLLLVGLLSLSPSWDVDLLEWRIFATIIGSVIAISSGFLIAPIWDKKEFPKHLSQVLEVNYAYFRNTFYNGEAKPWLEMKSKAELANSIAFDSLNRTIKEPTIKKDFNSKRFFQLLTHFVRVTRELNNFNEENSFEAPKIKIIEKENFIQLLHECDDNFRIIANYMEKEAIAQVAEECRYTYPVLGLKMNTPSQRQWVYMQKLLLELQYINQELKEIIKEKN